MADLVLKRLSMRNWMTCRETDIEFPTSGLVLLSGVIGSGKTGLTEALGRMLFGASGRFPHFGDYSLDEKGNTYLKLETEFRGRPLVIESGYCCREMSLNGEALRYSYDGEEPVERGKIAETRKEINALLGISRELAESLICVDGDKLKFNRMGQGDLVEIVMQVLNQPSWDKHYATARNKLNAFRRDLAEDTSDCEHARNKLATAKERVTEAEDDVQTAEDEKASKEKSRSDSLKVVNENIAELEKQQNTYQDTMEDLAHQIRRKEKQLAKEEHEVEIRRNDLNEGVRKLQEQKETLVEKRTTLKNAVDAAKQTLDDLSGEPETCPTCSKPWDKKHGADEIAKAEKAHKDALKKYNQQRTICEAADEDLQANRDKAADADRELREFRTKFNVQELSLQHEDTESLLADAQREIHRWQLEKAKYEKPVDNSAVASAKAVLKERREFVTECEEAVTTAAAALAESQEGIRIIEYWTKAFSPNGIPNMILNETVAPLNDVAQRVSHQLGRGMMEVFFSTSKQLQSGEQKPHLNVQVRNRMGSNKAIGCSKGESTLTNLVILESLSELGRISPRVGLRVFDEPFTNANEAVARALYSYLAELAKTSLIFLADHNPVASSYAHYVMGVEKGGEGTVYAWQ